MVTLPIRRLALSPANAGGARDAEASKAVAAFAALLEPAPGARVLAGDLQNAYLALAGAKGWPVLDKFTLGALIRAEVDARGGTKLKSRGQQLYVGVRLPQQLEIAS